MGRAYFLIVGDKTTCGGTIVTGCANHIINGQPTACEGDHYICGSDKQLYQIVGGTTWLLYSWQKCCRNCA